MDSGSWHGGIDIGTLDAGGKGMVKCESKSIPVWSMGTVPVLK